MFFSLLFFMVYLVCLFYFVYSFFINSFLVSFYLFDLSGVAMEISFVFDYISLGFFCCVSFISCVVFSYSMFYMSGTVDERRFLWLVYGFVFSMGLLVFSGNFFLVMVGWDGLGLVSFCLVIFYSNHSSLESGLITVFSNRVGDVFFLISFFYFFVSGSFSFSAGSYFYNFWFFLFLFLGAITKSAQLPFSAWLPAAMAAPTPVSSLVHSSTLVTAGVYVLIRFFYIFSFFNFIWFKIFFLLTMFLAGVCANLENDFKKVVAMSTLSQLGLMLFTISLGVWVLSFLHLIIHAFFKSMLFLSTGSLMSHMAGGQDSRFFGGYLYSYSSFIFFVCSSFCLMGFPFYIGFYSKDLIILMSSINLGLTFYFLFFFSCVLTVLYSLRLLFSGYGGVLKLYSFLSVEESSFFVFPVLLLFFKSWLLGGSFYWFFLSDSLLFFSGWDVVTGLFIMGLGALLTVSLKYYFLNFYLYLIGFLRWFSSGGSSYSFSKFSFHNWDSGWLEFGGGQGAFVKSMGLGVLMNSFKGLSLGLLLLFFCLLSVVVF